MLIPCSKEQTGEGFQSLVVEHVHVKHVALRLSPLSKPFVLALLRIGTPLH